MILVSGNMKGLQIFAGVIPLGGGVKWQWGCRQRQFWRFRWPLPQKY